MGFEIRDSRIGFSGEMGFDSFQNCLFCSGEFRVEEFEEWFTASSSSSESSSSAYEIIMNGSDLPQKSTCLGHVGVIFAVSG